MNNFKEPQEARSSFSSCSLEINIFGFTRRLYFRSRGFERNCFFFAAYITHNLSKIIHIRLRNSAVSLSIFQLPRHCNNPPVRSQSDYWHRQPHPAKIRVRLCPKLSEVRPLGAGDFGNSR